MITMAEIIEKARLAGMDKFVDVNTVNRGWFLNLLTGKKVRMTQDELDAQAKFIEDCMTEDKMGMTEEAPVPTMDNVMEQEPKQEPKKAKKEMSEIDWEKKLKYMVEHTEEGQPYEISTKLANHILDMVEKGKGNQIKTVIIQCSCGRNRMIKVQDRHQVYQCHRCARETKNARRRKSMKSA